MTEDRRDPLEAEALIKLEEAKEGAGERFEEVRDEETDGGPLLFSPRGDADVPGESFDDEGRRKSVLEETVSFSSSSWTSRTAVRAACPR